MIVAVTGGIGSGKSFVIQEFSKFPNVVAYIADEEAKKLMTSSNDIRKKMIQAFGAEAYVKNELNREFIASIVFNDAQKLKEINAIVHPEVFKHFFEFTKLHKGKMILYESALVFETGSAKHFDYVITVTAPIHTRIERLIERDKTTQEHLIQRMSKQWKEDKKTLQSHYIISNQHIEETETQIKRIYNILTEKS